jgi:glycogen(starch) synthase
MKVLMFGWEFPPFNSGGLGTACYGITKSLSQKGTEIDFVLPKNTKGKDSEFVNLISADSSKTRITAVDSLIQSYMTSEGYFDAFHNLQNKNRYEYRNNLIDEVQRYAMIAKEIAAKTPHDIIHCHDWMTLPAGIEASKVSKKPLIAHIHSTEADRSGGRGVNPRIFHIESEGVKKADKIIAVSNLTKAKIKDSYHIKDSKIEVVYNGIDKQDFEDNTVFTNPFNKKIVLFLGRLTLHKGPDYFIKVAKKVIDRRDDVIFIVSGSGDMYHKIIENACDLGIGDKVLFTGFLRDKQLRKIYRMANLYVMPSVAEPFGITPLESLASKTPVLISKQSGVSEVLNHCLKVDFWDTNEMANKILAVLENQELEDCLAEKGYQEIDKLNWSSATDKILDLYKILCPINP